MITKNTFKDAIISMGFKEQESDVYIKNFQSSSQMKVDFNKKKLEYADGIRADRDTTKDFHQSENFVVFECVCSLLERGYAPSNIVLEASVGAEGRGQTNTYLDILVKDNDENNYLIIECKTADGTSDDEFSKAWHKVSQDGGQLFNYFTLFRTPHLCLYASDFVDGHIKRYSNLIILKDANAQYLDDTGKEGYRDLDAASGQNDYFRVWQNTYEQAFLTKGIFETEAKPYEISTKITRTFDELQEMEDYQEIQRKYNEFATIMRQHNVGSHENAFDKLVNLFLAKIVDEESNKLDLKFNWKTVAFDDYYSFQDRLQALYTRGMKKFLGEDVTYINEENIQNAFERFRNDPDETRKKIIEYFREQKFYSNNDFAFLDVHNKELFLKNMEILIKIVQMLQDIRLKSERENQFLGDLFEGFLDSGVKQSEGQFFTPIPIVKFLISSLPIENVVRDCSDAPRVIDYACGAGHFLNEIARQIKPYAEQYKKQMPIGDFYKAIVGIEKEYRLSKVAKVSAFMYSQDEIRIIYADALADNKEIRDGSFNILVANPPYSVKGFLETLTEEERCHYSLYNDDLNLEKNNSIETFFIERAKQLLTPGGVCAIILPSSVLSNGGIYMACREIILKYFDMVAIAEFGSGTFGKTGTNTVTLFMRRKNHEVDASEHLKNRAEAWLKGNFVQDVVFEDAHLLDSYCSHCKIDVAEYRAWCSGGEMPNAEIFTDYVKAAKSQTRYKNIQKKQITARYTEEQKTKELDAFVVDFVHNAEQDKLYCYLLAADVSQPIVIAKSPADNKAIKTFLGYEWSGAKGNEGIKYLGQAVSDDENQLSKNKGIQGINTPLFDPKNYNNPEKINTIIRRNFQGESPLDIVPDSVKYARLVDMIDFSRATMDKAIRTNASSKIEIVSKYPLVKLGDYVDTIGGLWTGKKLPFKTVSVIRNTNFTMSGNLDFSDVALIDVEETAFQKRKLKYGDIIVEKSGGSGTQAVGRVVFYSLTKDVDYSFSNFTARIRVKSKELRSDFLHLYLNDFYQKGYTFEMQNGASGLKNLDLDRYLSLKVPLPPLSVQQQIVDEYTVVDKTVEASSKTINELKAQIESVVASVKGENKKLKEITTKIGSGATPLGGSGVYKLEGITFIRSQNVYDNKFEKEGIVYINEKQAKDLENVVVEKGDVLFNITGASVARCCVVEDSLLPARVNQHVAIIRSDGSAISKFIMYMLIRKKEELVQIAKGATSREAITKSQLENFSIPIPSISDQKQVIAEIETYEAKIAEAKQVIDASNARKQAILDKYLQ